MADREIKFVGDRPNHKIVTLDGEPLNFGDTIFWNAERIGWVYSISYDNSTMVGLSYKPDFSTDALTHQAFIDRSKARAIRSVPDEAFYY